MSALATRDLTIGYPGRTLVTGLAMRLEAGQCWAVLGNNGGGKSTLLRTLAGLLHPLAGKVDVDGVDVRAMAPVARARRVAVLLQEESAAFWGDVLDYVLLGRYPHRHGLFGWTEDDLAIAGAAIDRVDLAKRMHQSLSTLSGGERQRARLALMLAQDADILLLDEPLQHLDLRHQSETMRLLRELATARGKTVCMVLHDPLIARLYCDHALLVFDDATCETGRVESLLSKAKLERLYQCPVHID